jgi:hypothetical protein
MRLARVLIMAEMHGRDLLRRHVAIGLLVALPFSFYLASSDSGPAAAASGGVALAFAVSGAALFSVLSSRSADQRLILSGYRPFEMLLGRLLFLGPLALVIAGVFSLTMAPLSSPARPWVLVLGVAVVALQSVPFGLAIGSAVPRELEGTLVLIGVVGIQLATRLDSVASKLLPFYGPRELLEASLSHHAPIGKPLFQTFFYGVALLIAARLFVSRRVNIVRHEPLLLARSAAGVARGAAGMARGAAGVARTARHFAPPKDRFVGQEGAVRPQAFQRPRRMRHARSGRGHSLR